MEIAHRLESRLCELHQKKHCVLVGNGTTGIFLALKAAGLQKKKIAIPNGICTNVPMGILFSNNFPLYLDISPQNLGLDPNDLYQHSDIQGVIAVHAYGSVCEIGKTREFCQKRNCFLIEDFCTAQGARVDSLPVGSFGDASVVSFGAGKIIDVGHGGAVLSDDKSLIDEISRLNDLLPAYSPSTEEFLSDFNKFHTKLYNDHFSSDLNSFWPEFKRKANATKEKLLAQFHPEFAGKIWDGLKMLDKKIENRREKAENFSRFFSKMTFEKVEVYNPPPGSVFWRSNIFLKGNRDKVLKTLLKEKFKVSSWFPPVGLFFAPREEFSTPVSNAIGDSILNLWVNEEVDKQYETAISKRIFELLGGGENGE